MPTRILEADSFAETMYYTEEQGSDLPDDLAQDNAFYIALKRCPALAMIAAKIHDLAVMHYPISTEHMAVLIVNMDGLKGFQILFHDDCTEEERGAGMEFLEELEEAAVNNQGIVRDTDEGVFFGAENESILLDFLINFAAANDYDFNRDDVHLGYEGDFAAFHAQWPQKEHETWEEDARDALTMAWVLAALPEKIYPSQDLLLKEAYLTRYLGIYPEEQIRHAIETQKIARKREDGWSCAFH